MPTCSMSTGRISCRGFYYLYAVPKSLDAEVRESALIALAPTDPRKQDLEALPTECQLLGPDKKREVDPRLKLMLVETLILLCATAEGRGILKTNSVYRIVQVMHLTEKDETVR